VIIPVEGIGVDNASGTRIHRVLTLLREVDDMPKLYGALQHLARYSDAANFSFIARCTLPVGSTLLVVSDLPRRWSELYELRNYEEMDPIAVHCRARLTPILWWSRTDRTGLGYSGRTRSFVSEARRFGMRSGASFPLHGIGGARGALTISFDRDLEETRPRLEQCMPYIQLLSTFVFEAAARAIGPQQCPIQQEITRREMECLLWCSEGKTSWEIAKILGITERTVHFHVQNASRKLGASSRSHAVRLALQTAGATGAQNPPQRVIRMWGAPAAAAQVDPPAEDAYPMLGDVAETLTT
jgi:LuxR family transcriptional activator of bioluminescence operon